MMIDWKRDINWERVFGVIEATSNLKRNQTRPLRTEIIEKAIAKYSGGKLEYVGDAADGMDFICTSTGARIECKLQQTVFPVKASHTRSIVGKNFRGTKQEVHELKQTYDTMLMIDTGKRRVGVCDWDACEYTCTDACASFRVPVEKCEIIVDGVMPDQSLSGKDFNSIIFEAIEREI